MDNSCFRLEVPWGRRLAIFVGLFLACMLIGSVLMAIVSGIGGVSVRTLNLSIVIQNVIVFTVPAIAAAVMLTRSPNDMLYTDKAPQWKYIAIVVLVAVVSLPAMNWIVDWNQNLHLPASMYPIEQVIRQVEEMTMEQTRELLATESVYALIVTLLTVGVLTGFGEEIFFRGALLRILQSKPINVHVAIWVVAFVFSAVHFQFLGFVPRMLLGAWFGYLMWWSRSLWVPVIAHALNNSISVLSAHIYGIDNPANPIERLGLDNEWLALASALLTVLIIMLTSRVAAQKD